MENMFYAWFTPTISLLYDTYIRLSLDLWTYDLSYYSLQVQVSFPTVFVKYLST